MKKQNLKKWEWLFWLLPKECVFHWYVNQTRSYSFSLKICHSGGIDIYWTNKWKKEERKEGRERGWLNGERMLQKKEKDYSYWSILEAMERSRRFRMGKSLFSLCRWRSYELDGNGGFLLRWPRWMSNWRAWVFLTQGDGLLTPDLQLPHQLISMSLLIPASLLTGEGPVRSWVPGLAPHRHMCFGIKVILCGIPQDSLTLLKS